MLNQKKWFVMFTVFFLGLAVELIAPEGFVRTANAETRKEVNITKEGTGAGKAVETVTLLCAEDIWKTVSKELKYGEMNSLNMMTMALAEVKEQELSLMASSTDHIVKYHGKRFVISDDEYQVLLKIVEAEAPAEDIKGKMLVANVVLNRMELNFGGDTISEVVFAKGQFEPVSNGRIYKVTPSAATIEAVERVLDGEDESQGALYFMARSLASKRGISWFERNLKFLFEHGGHEFYTEKD